MLEFLKRKKRTQKKRRQLFRRMVCESLERRELMSASDPFAEDAPAFDTSAPEPTTFQRGDYSISEKTGAATYSYPIVVPPGRGGMEPNLGLSYSSRAPLRGGIAAGWSLSLPSIEVDTSGGTTGERRFMATLGGAVGRLGKSLRVSAPTREHVRHDRALWRGRRIRVGRGHSRPGTADSRRLL